MSSLPLVGGEKPPSNNATSAARFRSDSAPLPPTEWGVPGLAHFHGAPTQSYGAKAGASNGRAADAHSTVVPGSNHNTRSNGDFFQKSAQKGARCERPAMLDDNGTASTSRRPRWRGLCARSVSVLFLRPIVASTPRHDAGSLLATRASCAETTAALFRGPITSRRQRSFA